MADSETQAPAPTVEETLTAYKGFSTENGKVSSVQEGKEKFQDAPEPEEPETKPTEGKIKGDSEAESQESEERGEKSAQKAEKHKESKPKKDLTDSEREYIAEIKQLRRQMRRQGENFDAWRADMERRLTSAQTKDTKPKEDAAPKAEDFQFGELDAGYIRALARYETRQELKQAQESQKAQQTQVQQREAATRDDAEFAQKVEAFNEAGMQKYDDFEDVVIEGAKEGDWPVSRELAQLIVGDQDNGPDVAYYLATHVREAKNLARMTPIAQAAWFGRHVASLSSGAAPAEGKPRNQPKTTQAPPPVQQARGAGSTTQARSDTEDFSAFEQMARAALRRK